MSQIQNFYVYLLQAKKHNKTYVGFTVDPDRRIRQHNRELRGGAAETGIKEGWRMILKIVGFKTKKHALRFESMFQKPLNRKLSRKVISENVKSRADGSLERKLEELEYLIPLYPHKLRVIYINH